MFYCPEIYLPSHPSHPVLFNIDFTNNTAECLYQLVNIVHPPDKNEYVALVNKHSRFLKWDNGEVMIHNTAAFFELQWIEMPSVNIRSQSHPGEDSLFSPPIVKPPRASSNPVLLAQRSKDPLALQLSRLFPENSVDYRDTLVFTDLEKSSREIAISLSNVDILTPRGFSIAIQALEGVLFYPIRAKQIAIIYAMVDGIISPHFSSFIEDNHVSKDFYQYIKTAIIQAMSNCFNAGACQFDASPFEQLVKFVGGSQDKALQTYYKTRAKVAKLGLTQLLSLFDPNQAIITDELTEKTITSLSKFKESLGDSFEILRDLYQKMLALTVASGLLQLKIKDNQNKPKNPNELQKYAALLEDKFYQPYVIHCLKMAGQDSNIPSLGQSKIVIHQFRSLHEIIDSFCEKHQTKKLVLDSSDFFKKIKSIILNNPQNILCTHLNQPDWVKPGTTDQDYWLVVGVSDKLEQHLNAHNWSLKAKDLDSIPKTIWDLIAKSVHEYQMRDVITPDTNPTGNFSI